MTQTKVQGMRLHNLVVFSILSACVPKGQAPLSKVDYSQTRVNEKLQEARGLVSRKRIQLLSNQMDELKENPEDEEGIRRRFGLLDSYLKQDLKKYERKMADFARRSRNVRWIVEETPDEAYPTMTSFEGIYHSTVAKTVREVYRDHGPLYVKPTLSKTGSGKAVLKEWKAKHEPWAGSWNPLGNPDVYKALEAWDKVIDSFGFKFSTADDERDRMAPLDIHKGDGMCTGWSFAAVLTQEPTETLIFDGTELTPAIQKTLLTYAHLQADMKQYGVSYKGDGSTDGSFQDIKPEVMHRLFQVFMRDQERGLVMDEVASSAIWHKPVYKYHFMIEDEEGDLRGKAFKVTTKVFVIRHRHKESDEVTQSKERLMNRYVFRFYIDPKDVNEDGEFRVIAGQWLNEPDTVESIGGRERLISGTKSFDNHPCNIKVPTNPKEMKSPLDQFNRTLELLEEHVVNR